MTSTHNGRRLPVALAACVLAAGLPIQLAGAQTPTTTSNPVDQLPAPQPIAAPPGGDNSRILQVPAPQQAAPDRMVTPQRFNIEGVNAIAFDEVAALFKPLVGKAVSIAKISAIAREVTARYKTAGYALSFCFIPEQDLKNGTVRVVAVEGYIASVRIEGDAGAAEGKLRDLASMIQQDKPLKLENFERYTQLMSQLPGLRVEATATPPTMTDGKGSLLLKVSRQAFSLSAGTDVRSSRPRAVITATLNDPLIAGSRLTASTLIGALPGESFVAAGYSQVIGDEGLTLKAEVSLYHGNPDALLDRPPPITRTTTYQRAELSASYPLLLTRSESLVLGAGVYSTHNADTYANAATGAALSDDVRVRAAYAQAAYAKSGADYSQSLVLRLTHGLNSMGAMAAITGNIPGPFPANPARLDFSKLVIDGSRRDLWGKKWGTSVSFSTQQSPHQLPSTERVSFGSVRFGRAYPAGAIAGDKGWGVALEASRSFTVDSSYVKQFQPYVLLEHARASSNGGVPTVSRLGSASVGFRITDGRYYSIDLAASKPTGDALSDNPERKIRLSTLVSYNFEKR